MTYDHPKRVGNDHHKWQTSMRSSKLILQISRSEQSKYFGGGAIVRFGEKMDFASENNGAQPSRYSTPVQYIDLSYRFFFLEESYYTHITLYH